MCELWLDVIGFEKYYQVSSIGRVKRKKRQVKHNRASTIEIQERILSPYSHNSGYLVIDFQIEKKRKTLLVHRLVAEAFIENPKNLPQVNHIDGDKKNPTLKNLEWVNNSENQLHAYKNKLQPSKRGENNSKAKITEKDAIEIAYLIKKGNMTLQEIGNRFGLSKSSISLIKRGKSWSHLNLFNSSEAKK